jgi:alpha-galactosidase
MNDQSCRLGPCFARFAAGELLLGNDRIQRRWFVGADGLLRPRSISFRPGEGEWLARPSVSPSPVPPYAVPDEERTLTAKLNAGRFGPTEGEALRAEVRCSGASLAFIVRFDVFPGAPAVRAQLILEHVAPDLAAVAPPDDEAVRALGSGQLLLGADALEWLDLVPPHLRLGQVTLLDDTDRHNELVHERAWLLQPNEEPLGLVGNLFFLENTLTGDSLVFLKHAPPPHARSGVVGPDLIVHPRRGDAGRIVFEQPGSESPELPLAWQLGLYGHGPHPAGYAWATLVCPGGAAGRTEALHAWQRQLRIYQPGRDGLLLSNTWGDRSNDARVCEPFMLGEVEAAARLGVDVVQIDDGWQHARSGASVEADGPELHAIAWAAHPQRFPNGLEPIAEACRERGLEFGLWFVPDRRDDYAHWERDADTLLDLWRRFDCRFFKIDGTTLTSPPGERNLGRFMDRVLAESEGTITLDFDVTAGRRFGYFGACGVGPLFVENRYTDFRRWWPHHTLRCLWKLARYVDPVRLRMEFLNQARNAALYAGDPLAPASWSPEAIFATVMFASPLAWFEVQNLPASYFERLPALIATWREHREAIHTGRIHPIGDAPDGRAWTGFVSAGADDRSGYLLVFRERNPFDRAEITLPVLNGEEYEVELLGGSGHVAISGGRGTVFVPDSLGFIFARAG